MTMHGRNGNRPSMFRYSSWKGNLERVLALLLTIVLSPLFALIVLGIYVDSIGSPIFAQERIGLNGRRFTVYKFRTMHQNNDDTCYKEYIKRLVTEDAPFKVDEQGRAVYKLANDPRVTRFGTLLRKTNLDELPQIFNVLKGEMSFIGPRPDVPFAVEMYQDWQRKRLSVKPGITGLWQVCGRKSLTFNDMARLDNDYVENQSLFLDTKIILLTLRTVLTGDGS